MQKWDIPAQSRALNAPYVTNVCQIKSGGTRTLKQAGVISSQCIYFLRLGHNLEWFTDGADVMYWDVEDWVKLKWKV